MTEPSDTSPQRGPRATAQDVRTVAKGGAVQFVGFGVNRGLSLVFVAVAVRFLEPAGFGLYRQVAQLLQMIGNVGPGGFDYSALRSIARARAMGDPGATRGAARVAVIGGTLVSMVLFLAVLVLAGPIARAFAERADQAEQMAFLFRIGAAFIPFYSLMQVLRLSTQGYKTVVPSVIVGNIIQPTTMFLVSVTALLLGFGVTGAVVGLVASVLAGFVAGIWYLRRIRPPEEKKAKSRAPVREMVGFAIPQTGISMFRVGGMGPAVLLLGLLSTDRQVGLFSIGNSLQSLAFIFPKAMLSIWSPMVADLHGRGEMERLESLYQTINRWVASFSFFLIVALIFQPEFFVRVLGGHSAADAAMITSVLAIGTLFSVGTGPSAQLITMTGYPGINLANSIVGLIVFLGASWFVVPVYGGVGMAVVDSTVTTLVNVARVVEGRILTGIQPFDRSFLKPVVATLSGAAVLVGWRYFVSGDTALVLVGLLIAGAVHFGVLLLMGVDAEDRIVYKRIRGRLRSLMRRQEPLEGLD